LSFNHFPRATVQNVLWSLGDDAEKNGLKITHSNCWIRRNILVISWPNNLFCLCYCLLIDKLKESQVLHFLTSNVTEATLLSVLVYSGQVSHRTTYVTEVPLI